MGTPEDRSLFHQSRSQSHCPGTLLKDLGSLGRPHATGFDNQRYKGHAMFFTNIGCVKVQPTASNQHKHWLHTTPLASLNQDIQPLGQSQMRLAAPGRKTSTGHKVGPSLSGSSPAFFQPCTRSRKLLCLCLRSPPATHMLTRAPNARPAKRPIGIRNPEARTDFKNEAGNVHSGSSSKQRPPCSASLNLLGPPASCIQQVAEVRPPFAKRNRQQHMWNLAQLGIESNHCTTNQTWNSQISEGSGGISETQAPLAQGAGGLFPLLVSQVKPGKGAEAPVNQRRKRSKSGFLSRRGLLLNSRKAALGSASAPKASSKHFV